MFRRMPRHILLILLPVSLTSVVALADPTTQPRTEVEAGWTHENLNHGYADWRALGLDLEHHVAPRRIYYAGLRQTERFGLRDTEAKAGAYLPLGESWTLNLEGSASGSHRVLPEYALYAQLHRALDSGWGVSAGMRHSQYTANSTDTANFMVERYWGSLRAAYTLYLGRPEGAGTGVSHRVQLSRYYAERSYLGLSVTRGREVESIGPGRVLTSDVEAIYLTGRHWFGRDWAISYELGQQRQGELYTRQNIYVALRHQF